MPDSTLYSLAVLIDNRAIYAGGHADGIFKEHAPGLDPVGELRLRTLLWSSLEKILRLEALTDAELDACKQALDWYTEFEQAEGISLDAPRAMLDAWNRPEDLPDPTAAGHLGVAILEGSLVEEGAEQVAQRTEGSQVLAQGSRERGVGGTTDVPEEIHVACLGAEMTVRHVPWLLQWGHVEDAAAGLDDAIEALRGVRERIVG